MKRLVIDIKDGYAVLAAGGDFRPEFIRLDFDEVDFSGDSGEGKSPSSLSLFDIGDEHALEIYKQADQVILSVPMRFSMVKTVTVDLDAVKKYGDEFLQWEAKQQLPDELGQFAAGFKRLGKSFDNKRLRYMFYATPKDFIEVLSNFVTVEPDRKPILEPEALGLYNILNLVADNVGFNAAVSIEHDGAAIVIAQDGEFIAGRFIAGEKPTLAEEIMYFILTHAPEDIKPGLLIGGDLNHLDNLGNVAWAENLSFKKSLQSDILSALNDPEPFMAAIGLNMNLEKPR